MKKNIYLLASTLIFLFTLLLTACGNQATPATPSPGVLTQATSTVPTFVPSPSPGTTNQAVIITVSTTIPVASTPTQGATTTRNSTVAPTSLSSGAIKCVPNLPCQPRLTTVSAILTTPNGKEVPVLVELARTPQEQQTGLMGRAEMGANEGMLFIFSSKTNVGFYMRNTALPLSIAFIDERGVIVDIKDMQPFDERTVSPNKEYIMALEMNQGFFARNNILIGNSLKLPS
jgi:hypothetical protein